ncbi:XRE family transcriptional regulator [Streptomyces graminilatus]|uniref:XRE family transcriptional regulator n=1 Tax=Streptomyces graminilatus TaxID=1464070 RepID=UPI000ACBD81F|nr:XRE family transcriptional regulator [Streptomyces graminilatus]
MASEPRYRLVKPGLMRELMDRTGTGSDVSGRELASKVGIPHGTIDALLSGNTKTQPSSVAHEICRVIGVDLLILWAPTGRAVPAEDTSTAAPHLAVSA